MSIGQKKTFQKSEMTLSAYNLGTITFYGMTFHSIYMTFLISKMEFC